MFFWLIIFVVFVTFFPRLLGWLLIWAFVWGLGFSVLGYAVMVLPKQDGALLGLLFVISTMVWIAMGVWLAVPFVRRDRQQHRQWWMQEEQRAAAAREARIETIAQGVERAAQRELQRKN